MSWDLLPEDELLELLRRVALGFRRTVTGLLVAPQFPLVAAAQADGMLSDRHAAVIVKTVQDLPEAVADRFGEFVEKSLVEDAAGMDPRRLSHYAHALAYALDQDGQLAEEKHRERKRGLGVRRRPDGSARLEAELTAEAAEYLTTVLAALTRPARTMPAPPPSGVTTGWSRHSRPRCGPGRSRTPAA